MARRIRQGRRGGDSTQRQGQSYPHGLKETIRKYLPPQFFSRWKLTGTVTWTVQRIFWMALLMSWSAEQTLAARFEAVRAVLKKLFPKWSLGTSYTGWYDAQAKWIKPLKSALSQRLQQQMQTMAGQQWRREGWCAFAVDGSRVECPRTQANEQGLGCAGRNKTGPQLFLTTLWHMGTGLPWDFRIGPGTASERRHLEEMLTALPEQALIVADAGFTGYDLCQRIATAKKNFLLRVGANVHLLKKLGYVKREGADTVYLWPEDRRRQEPLVLRLLVLCSGGKKMHLLTNVLDKKALPDQAAARLYEMRWGVEVFYRSLKQTLQRRRMLSHGPEAAKCELTWVVFGIWLMALASVAGRLARGGDPLCWSAALARDRVRRSMRLALEGHSDLSLAADLGRVSKDNYQRQGSKKARGWPHKKKEQPPGSPKIQEASPEQLHAAQCLKTKNAAA
jgi:Transposase DDE domain